ncbi:MULTISPECIES: thioredoxin domain-containing protein [unclassified Agromyces]|uniref:thioredoxin domain-containing protein n=1 Tax=unclassified Agromyces TaxID=2639701 RepID=UPI00301445C6
MGNRLGAALSPYLRAHSENPVDWFPWGDAAFDEARRRDVPVLVSIGYATCHWCHVMARESFSDPEIARVLNDRFVSIKVDREEHPDVDASYLAAASAFTRELGWPLTVFTRPDGRAFYAGTYFPPRPIQGVPSFADVLAAVDESWRERRGDLDLTADAVGEALAAASVARTSGDLPDEVALRTAAENLAQAEDRRFGGFGGAPKFPVAPVLGFLAHLGGDARELAARTLRRMGASPLRDPVEGGFFRYATQADWSDPHYERMLTDNALLLAVAAELGTGADAPTFTESLADGLIDFLTERMQLPSGGFASAQDSESVIDGRRSEGGYYRRDASGRAELEPPALDEKVLTGWNGLAIGALARAGSVFADARAITSARRAADFVLKTHLGPDGRLARASLDGELSDAVATLEDAGMLAGGLLRLAMACGEVRYAVAARDLVDAASAAAPRDADVPFAAPAGPDPVLAARGLALPADPAEGATPSGVTACAAAAFELYALGAGDRYRMLAERAMRSVGGIATERPIAFGGSLEVMARLAAPLVQLVTVLPGGRRGDVSAGREDAEAEGEALLRAARRQPASVSAIVTDEQAEAFAAAGFELFEERRARDGRGAAYLCRAFVCALPVTSADGLAAIGRPPA